MLPFSVDWIPFVNNVIGSNGRNFVDLSGDVTAGGIKQTICTNSGQTYKLLFDLNVNPANGLGNAETMLVIVGDQSFDFSAIPDGSLAPPWMPKSVTFTASSSSTVIQFRSLGSDNTGPLLDNVRLMGEDCQLSVPLFPQGIRPPHDGHPPWEDDRLGSGSLTIASHGCALSSLAMALKSAGVSSVFTPSFEPINPGSLNRLLVFSGEGYGGQYEDDLQPAEATGIVNLFAIPNGLRLKFIDFGMGINGYDSIANPTEAYRVLDENLCAPDPAQRHPVIVKVRSPTSGEYPKHWVVVTGKETNPDGSSSYLIADPAGVGTRLEHYPEQSFGIFPEFRIRGIVKDPPDDLSLLNVSVGPGATLLLTDPDGNQTGFDPVAGRFIQDISSSSYFEDGIDDDITGELDDAVTHIVHVFKPLQGIYRLDIIGLTQGVYNLSVGAFSQDARNQPKLKVTGVAAPGSTSTFQIRFSSTPGGASQVNRVATFQSTLDDISNSGQLGLIETDGIARALSGMIEAAAKAAQRGDNKTSRNILQAFKNLVTALTPRNINNQASQVLLEDADSLLSQLPQ